MLETGDDHPLEVLLILQRVLDGEDAAPGMPEQEEVVAIQPERDPHLLHFLDVVVDAEERRHVVGLVAVVRAQLVVVVVLDAVRRQETVEGLERLVGPARPAVQQQHLDPRVVADALGPHPEIAGRGVDRDHAHAALPGIGATAVVEVGRRRPRFGGGRRQREQAGQQCGEDAWHERLRRESELAPLYAEASRAARKRLRLSPTRTARHDIQDDRAFIRGFTRASQATRDDGHASRRRSCRPCPITS